MPEDVGSRLALTLRVILIVMASTGMPSQTVSSATMGFGDALHPEAATLDKSRGPRVETEEERRPHVRVGCEGDADRDEGYAYQAACC